MGDDFRPRVSGHSTRRAFRMTAEVSREAAQSILRGTEERLDDGALLITLTLEFDGRSPFPLGSRHTTPQGGVFPVRIFPPLWDSVAAAGRLLRGRSSEEEVKLLPTFYALHFRREGNLGRVALVSWEKAESVTVAETRLALVDLGGTCWSLANSVLAGIVQHNPVLKGNLTIRRFSESLNELSRSLSESGWRGLV